MYTGVCVCVCVRAMVSADWLKVTCGLDSQGCCFHSLCWLTTTTDAVSPILSLSGGHHLTAVVLMGQGNDCIW